MTIRAADGVAFDAHLPVLIVGAGPAGACLALLLAETLSATALVVHGSVAVPAGSRVPVRRT